VSLKIVCSGHLVRHPLGGHCWHHLQYLVGLRRLGHHVTFFEDYGWPYSCYDPSTNDMSDDPSYGITFMLSLLDRHGLQNDWCFLAADGTAHGISREELSSRCRECDVYFNLSNVNWISELQQCRKRVLVDTDPVFTQIGECGMGGPFDRYHRLFTFGENVHRNASLMPTAGKNWLPTRQPVVLDLWNTAATSIADAPWTTVMNWSAYGGGDKVHEGRVYGQKAREFEPFYSLPRTCETPMEMAVRPPDDVRARLINGGWRITDPLAVTRTPTSYQKYIARSRGEFSVAKHGYVSTRSGWFSDRSSAYLAMGRPIVVQDTGFSDFLPTGTGLHAWRTPGEAIAALKKVDMNYAAECRTARAIAEEHFAAERVLSHLLERSV
jgi:hypothetical protein